MKTLLWIGRRPALVMALIGAAACNASDGPSGPPFGPGDIVFRILPNTIFHEYIDTSAGFNYRLRWLADTTYVGINCIGFRPNSLGADTGSFQFWFAGANEGLLEELNNGSYDTVTGRFIQPQIGSHGAYSIDDTDSSLTLYWADGGTITRYFDPAADLRFIHPDTLRSTADLRFQGDSIRVLWDARWLARSCSL